MVSVSRWGRRWLDEVFPGRCQLCGCGVEYDGMLCAACKQDLPWLGHTCRQCAVPFRNMTQSLCGQCLSQAPFFDRVYSLFDYRRPVSGLIVALKFGQRLHLARLLGRLMIDDLVLRLDSAPDFILPVPLHPRRLRERGFNQALELARSVGKRFDVEIRSAVVERSLHRPPQVALSRRQRLKNTRGVFRVRDGQLSGHALIVDDVMTTGATVNELARMLKRNGVHRVDVATLARAGDIAETPSTEL